VICQKTGTNWLNSKGTCPRTAPGPRGNNENVLEKSLANTFRPGKKESPSGLEICPTYLKSMNK
jgi:hypothetical protein